MKLIALIVFLLPYFVEQQTPKIRVPLIREGTKIIEATGHLHRLSDEHPIVIEIPSDKDKGRIINSFIVLPNQRLAEMEASAETFPNRPFQLSGDVFAYGDQNYLLVREVASFGEHADRNHPTSVPIHPDDEVLQEEDFEDSVADIVDELETATGALARSIRNASQHPMKQGAIKEGKRISARRCRLIRNNSGAWIAIFVADSTGLSDPPCTILPSSSFEQLTRWASKQGPSTPVLLSGELLSYHGHGFLLVNTWRSVHKTDHLD